MISRSKASKTFIIGTVMALLTACASTPPLPPTPLTSDATTKTITGGQVSGFIDEKTGAHVWRSIPFAAPPVGDLRWRAPRPIVPWNGVRKGTEHAPWCPQIRGNFDSGPKVQDVPMGAIIGQEDCLYLNVHAPANASDQNLPVMMWIHGGSNTWGRAEQYDPSKLAARENVVVVVVQYRLGPLGWFAQETIRNSAKTELDRSANFGNLDHIAALNWIQDNAAEFGGDKDNVTIFGESAGGHNVVTLLASPKAKGLFHKAIIQSGSFASTPLEEAETTHPLSGHKTMARLFEDPAARTAENLRRLSLDDLYAAYEGQLDEEDQELPRIIQDGVVIPRTPLREAFNSPASFNAVPLITGTNKDEMKLWALFNDRLVKWVFGAIPVVRDKDFYNNMSDYPSRLWRVRSVEDPAIAMTQGGHSDVWTYRFDWDEGRKYFTADFAQLFGAAHSLEIPFVFGNFQFLGEADKFIFTQKNAPERLVLSDAMMSHWGHFARFGEPGKDWDKWSSGHIFRLDSASSGGTRMVTDPDSKKRILDQLAADPSVDAEQRCMVYATLRFFLDDPEGVVPATCEEFE